MVTREPETNGRSFGARLIQWATVLLALTFYAAVITFAFSDEASIREWFELVLS